MQAVSLSKPVNRVAPTEAATARRVGAPATAEAGSSPSPLGPGNSGNLLVTASDSLIVARARSDSPLNTALATNSVGTGRAGNIEINTRSLRVEGGASISSSSGLLAGQRLIPTGGAGGNITVNAKDSVFVIGTSAGEIPSPSAIGEI